MTSEVVETVKRGVGIAEPGVQPIGMFAVMKHTQGMKSARFVCLHKNIDSATKESRRLAAVSFETVGAAPFCYYVVQIVSRVGFIDGKFEGAV